MTPKKRPASRAVRSPCRARWASRWACCLASATRSSSETSRSSPDIFSKRRDISAMERSSWATRSCLGRLGSYRTACSSIMSTKRREALSMSCSRASPRMVAAKAASRTESDAPMSPTRWTSWPISSARSRTDRRLNSSVSRVYSKRVSMRSLAKSGREGPMRVAAATIPAARASMAPDEPSSTRTRGSPRAERPCARSQGMVFGRLARAGGCVCSMSGAVMAWRLSGCPSPHSRSGPFDRSSLPIAHGPSPRMPSAQCPVPSLASRPQPSVPRGLGDDVLKNLVVEVCGDPVGPAVEVGGQAWRAVAAGVPVGGVVEDGQVDGALA